MASVLERDAWLTVAAGDSALQELVAALQGYAGPVVAGFEATGNYHRPLAHRLLEAGIELRPISSLALARTPSADSGSAVPSSRMPIC